MSSIDNPNPYGTIPNNPKPYLKKSLASILATAALLAQIPQSQAAP